MEKTLLSVKDLTERWGISDTKVRDLETLGYIERIPEFGAIRFPISQVHDLENFKEVIRRQNKILYGD